MLMLMPMRTRAMLMASNLWVAEVCLPARTLRSVFGLSALVPPPQELVGGLVLARHDRHHHLGLEPHQAAHTLPALPPSHSLGPLVAGWDYSSWVCRARQGLTTSQSIAWRQLRGGWEDEEEVAASHDTTH